MQSRAGFGTLKGAKRMKYGKIKGLDKDISRMVFGTATPKLFAADRTECV